jgi:GT2 family glycosyltransferase
MTVPLLYIVILSSNRRNDTLACLASLFQADYDNFHVILLDNCFVDGLAEAVCKQYAKVQIVPLIENMGYAGNNNIGIRKALEQGAEWVLILNDDTVLDPTCITSLMHVVANDPAIGIAGPMIYHFDEPDVIQSAGGMLGKYWNSSHLGQDELDSGQFLSVHSVEWISGCAFLIRRATIEQVGLLDPNYFLYWEEMEWCIRAGKAGWKIVHVPEAKLWHKGVKRDYQPRPYVTYYYTRNHLLTLAKHRAPIVAWTYTIVQIFRSLVSWSLKPRWKSKRKHRNAMWMGLVHFLQGRFGKNISLIMDDL